jgi:hypothetical protein
LRQCFLRLLLHGFQLSCMLLHLELHFFFEVANCLLIDTVLVLDDLDSLLLKLFDLIKSLLSLSFNILEISLELLGLSIVIILS